MAKQKRTNQQILNKEDEILEQLDAENTEQLEDDSISVIGIVTDCLKLNIRKEAKADADVLCEAPALSKLMIDMSKSNDEWLSVCTEAGFEGFCMKKYVSIGQ